MASDPQKALPAPMAQTSPIPAPMPYQLPPPGPSTRPYCPPPPNCATPASPGSPSSPGTPGTPGSTAPPAQGTGETPSFNNPSFGAGLGSSIALAVPAAGGVSTTSAAQGTGTLVSTPLILPGLFTAATAQSAIPLDRVWFNYGYFDSMRVADPVTLTNVPATGPNAGTNKVLQSGGTQPGFSLNVFDLGVEKTLLGGRVSVYLDVPLLAAANNTSGQDISGIGDINIGFKGVLLQDTQSGSTWSAGLTVAVPTGHESVVNSYICAGVPGSTTGTVFPQASTSTTFNPTYIQPWTAAIWVVDRFFVQDYLGIIIPSDARVSTIINEDLTLGYTVYQSRGGFISSVTPLAGAQALIPVTHAGLPGGAGTQSAPAGTFFPAAGPGGAALPLPPAPNAFGFPDQLFITGGVAVGLNERALLTTAVVVPVVGPVGYSYGVTIGLNFFF